MSINIHCCVSDCTNEETDDDCWFYEFPENKQLRDLWMKQIGLPSESSAETQYLRVCSSHFDVSCFEPDGDLKPNAIPTNFLPMNVLFDPSSQKVALKQDTIVVEEGSTTAIELDEPIQLFVAIFVDEAGKIVNFSLVKYSTVEKWSQSNEFDFTVSEIFTSTDASADETRGLLGPFFHCNACKMSEKFGIVVMQKKSMVTVVSNVEEPGVIATEETEIFSSFKQENDESFIEEVPTEELEERLVDYANLLSPMKHKSDPIQLPTPNKKSRMTSIYNEDDGNLEQETTISDIKFLIKRSCNKCNFTSKNEHELESHVKMCTENYLSKIGFNNFKGSQRIRTSYTCSKCNLSILKRDIQAHAEFHVKLAPYACLCSKCFLTQDELDDHQKLCGRHLFTCKMCHKEFIKKKELYQHKLDAHGIVTLGQASQKRDKIGKTECEI